MLRQLRVPGCDQASEVDEHLGLLPGQATLLNDDCCGRALDHLFRSDRASLFTAIVLRAIKSFRLGLAEFHPTVKKVDFSERGIGPDDPR